MDVERKTVAVNEKTLFDIVICGGSFVGLALARTLCAEAPGAFSIAIVEQRPLPRSGEVDCGRPHGGADCVCQSNAGGDRRLACARR